MRIATDAFVESIGRYFTESEGRERVESGKDWTPPPYIMSRTHIGTKAHYGYWLSPIYPTSWNPYRRFLNLDTVEVAGGTTVLHCRDTIDRWTGAKTRTWVVPPICWGFDGSAYHYHSWPIPYSDPPNPADGGYYVGDTWYPYDVPQSIMFFGGGSAWVHITQEEADAFLAQPWSNINGSVAARYGAVLTGTAWGIELNSSNAFFSSWTGGDRFYGNATCTVTQTLSNEYTFTQLRDDAIAASVTSAWSAELLAGPYETYEGGSDVDVPGAFNYNKLDLQLRYAGYAFASKSTPVPYFAELATSGVGAVWVAAGTNLIEVTLEVPNFDPGSYYETGSTWVYYNKETDYLYTHQLETPP